MSESTILQDFFTNELVGSCKEIIAGDNLFLLRHVKLDHYSFDIIKQQSNILFIACDNITIATCFLYGGDSFWADEKYINIPFAIAVGVKLKDANQI